MQEMIKDEIHIFLLQWTFTWILGTINKNGRPHIVPICYTLDDENNIIFNTSNKSVKVKNIKRNNKVCLCADNQTPLLLLLMVLQK